MLNRMRKRITLLFICLFIPSYVYGDYCSDIGTDDSRCWNTPGCQYNSATGCALCEENKYCDGDHTEAQSCPNLFTNAPLGSKEILECYAKIDEIPDSEISSLLDGIGVSYTDPSNCSYNPCAVSRTAQNGTTYCDLRDCAFPIVGTPGTPWGGVWANGYFPPNTSYCPGMTNVACFTKYFHVEAILKSDNALETDCFTGPRNCGDFINGSMGSTATNCPNGSPITGTAEWDIDHWDISECTCEITDGEVSGKNCKGPHIKSPDVGAIVYLSTENVVFSPNPSSYYCTRCLRDDDTHKYYADLSITSGDGCTYSLNAGKVCACASNNQRGYFRTGTCDTDNSWGTDVCRGGDNDHKCPAGKTTSTPNPSGGVSNCEYDSQTKFCDAKGCFSFTEAELIEWGLNNP